MRPRLPLVTTAALKRAGPSAVPGAVLLGLVLLAAVFAGLIATHDPLAQDIPNRLRPPGRDFLFGTDSFGRDVFSRVVHGARLSLYVATASVVLGMAIGASIGVVSGYAGGRVDLLVQRLADVMLGFPPLALAIIVVVALGASAASVIAGIALAVVPQAARMARSGVLSVKEETYVSAARALGAGPVRTVLGHVLPNSLGATLAYAAGYFGTALIAEAALSFVGLGVPPPYPSWGRMLHEGARQYLEAAPWLTVFPGAALSVTVLGFVLLGDGLRDMLDPRSVGAGGAMAPQGRAGRRQPPSPPSGHRLDH